MCLGLISSVDGRGADGMGSEVLCMLAMAESAVSEVQSQNSRENSSRQKWMMSDTDVADLIQDSPL